jgi:putative flavoprotein involved in K+ transport
MTNSVAPQEAIVIGGGQSGLAAAWALQRRGITPVVLEAGEEPVGSWPRYYESLTLFSPARYSSLPGRPFPGDPNHYPKRDEVVDYLRGYAKHLDAEIRTGARVTAVQRDNGRYTVSTDDGENLTAAMVIAASGGFGRHYRPTLPGLDAFTGRVLHAGEYREPRTFAGQRIVVVGAGNSAVQIAVELAETANVTLATRKPIHYVPQRPLGRDVHFWLTVSGIDTAPIGPLVKHPPTQPVLDIGTYRAAVRRGRPDRRPMFVGAEGDCIVWTDGRPEHVDTVLLATGYRPNVGYLASLGALDATGLPLHRSGLATTHSGLAFVGLELQRSFSSATVRGVARDAAYVVNRLLRQKASS